MRLDNIRTGVQDPQTLARDLLLDKLQTQVSDTSKIRASFLSSPACPRLHPELRNCLSGSPRRHRDGNSLGFGAPCSLGPDAIHENMGILLLKCAVAPGVSQLKDLLVQDVVGIRLTQLPRGLRACPQSCEPSRRKGAFSQAPPPQSIPCSDTTR